MNESKNNLKLFFVALIQVMLVSMNVIFISKGYVLLLILTGFGISFSWSYNVKRIAIGNNKERIVYSLGAALGTLIGYYLANYLIKII
jgi:hypothetical protein